MSTFESVVAEMGLETARDGDVVHGRAHVHAEACAPDTGLLRTSIVATWADVVTGIIAAQATNPRVPLTLDLEVQVHRPAREGETVAMRASVLKAGRSVFVTDATFTDDASGEPIAVAVASFMASPNPEHVIPESLTAKSIGMFAGRLPVPFAERVGRTIVEPGVVEVPHRAGNLNSSGAIQGGVVALAVEEAAVSLAEEPTVLCSISLRYLRPLMVGPARAVATGGNGMAIVHVTDGGTGKVATVATARWGQGGVRADRR